MVEVSSDSSSDEDSLMERIKGRKVLATPAVRRIAMENKVLLFFIFNTETSYCFAKFNSHKPAILFVGHKQTV